MKSILFTALSLAFASSQAILGIDYSTPLSLSTHQCLRKSGFSFAIPRAWKSFGAFDANSLDNIKNARLAGFPSVDVYAFPCRGISAVSQID